MSFFGEDCMLEMPRGPDPWGRRLEGRVREGLASRFAGIPDVHYGDDRHWVAGDRGCSEWLYRGGARAKTKTVSAAPAGELDTKDTSTVGDGVHDPRELLPPRVREGLEEPLEALANRLPPAALAPLRDLDVPALR